MPPKHRPNASKRGRVKSRCPSCGSRNLSTTDSGDSKAGCLECGHFYTVGVPNKPSAEKGFGEIRASGTSRDVWLIRLVAAVVVIGAILFAIGIRIGISQGIASGETPPKRPAAQTKANPDRAAVDAEVTAAEKALSHEDRAMRETLGAFLGASSWAERVDVVRHPAVTAERMSRHYKDNEDGPFNDLVISTQITRVGSLIVFTLEGKGLPNKRLVMEETNGKYLVDWESFVLWQERPWSEISALSPDASCEIRCLARPLPNNHPAYRAEEGWLSFELVHPRSHEVLYGFMKTREGLHEKDPAAVLQKGAVGPVTLSVTSFSGGGAQQVLISEVLALGWVHPLPAGHRDAGK